MIETVKNCHFDI